jgi:hypothetical protein
MFLTGDKKLFMLFFIDISYFPLPFIPSRQGRGKLTFYEGVNFDAHAFLQMVIRKTFPEILSHVLFS